MQDTQSPVRNMYFQPEAWIHTYGALPTILLSKIYSGVYQLNMNQHKSGKNTTGMMLLSLLKVQGNNILPKWYEETIGLCIDRPEDGDLHTPSQPTCSHGWRCQARHYCAHANGLACLFRLRAPPFTSQLKLLHPCLSFWETNYENALQQVLCML